jgi:hypothetical protein
LGVLLRFWVLLRFRVWSLFRLFVILSLFIIQAVEEGFHHSRFRAKAVCASLIACSGCCSWFYGFLQFL